MGIYSQIKEQVSTRAVAEHYGYKVGRNGMMRCPFHNDQTPSMKADQNFICFGCQEKGNVIDFTAKLFGITPYEAAGKLIEDMGLTVVNGAISKAPPGAHQKARQAQMEEERFTQALKRVYTLCCDYFHLLTRWAEIHAPHSPAEELHPLFVEAMHQRDYEEYLLNLLLYGSKEDKESIVIEKGKRVNDLERRIQEFKSDGRERSPPLTGRAK